MAVPATACVPVAEGPQFVRALSRFGDSPAVIAPGAALTYRELDAWVDEAMAALPARRSVIRWIYSGSRKNNPAGDLTPALFLLRESGLPWWNPLFVILQLTAPANSTPG